LLILHIATAAASSPKQTATHFALVALENLLSKASSGPPNLEALTTETKRLLGAAEVSEDDLDAAIGEMFVAAMSVFAIAHSYRSARAPTADLPNMAAFLGGLVAQEAIKMITKQYVPINGYCAVDLVETWTGVVG
jgi:amyloid beta precursor protein binding protein 1